ncbi:MAG: ATP-binding protein [Planctomycetota bacterium]|jgi:PAS domain S-box-containing protein|nr:ATP-binding protein [Planctomycetota bacterium]
MSDDSQHSDGDKIPALEAEVRRLRRFESLAECSHSLVVVLDTQGKIVELNAAWQRDFGWTDELLCGHTFIEMVHRDDIAKTIAASEALASDSLRSGFVNRWRTAAGAWRWLRWNGFTEGAVMVGVAEDITELMTEQQEQVKQEELLRLTGRMGRIGGWELELGAESPKWSEEIYRIHEVPLGHYVSLADAIGFYAPESRPIIEHAVTRGLEHGVPWDLELQLITMTGRRIWVRSQGAVERTGGAPKRLYGTFQDITDRKRLELQVEEHGQVLGNFLSVTADQELDTSGKFQRLLQLGLKTLGLDIGLVAHISQDAYTVRESLGLEAEAPPVGACFDVANTFCSQVLESGDTCADHHVGSSELAQYPCYQCFQIESYVGTPIWVDGKLYGTLSLSSGKPRQPFSERELDLVRLLAQWVGSELGRERTLQQLGAAKEAAVAASVAKSTFLATMSHEIRTPMNGVMGMAEVLLGDKLNDQQRDRVETIRSSGAALLTVINEVLDLSKIEAGKMALESRPFAPVQTISAVADLMRPHAEQRGLDLSVTTDWPPQVQAVGDELRLRQVVMNFLGNAIKFTDAGSVAVRLSHAEAEGGRRRLRIEVEDTGCGVDDAAESLFEAFTQADTGHQRRHGGTGLGLAICRELARLMGGEVGYRSELGVGSVFHLELCVETCAAVPDAVVDVVDFSTEGLRVLVAEDNVINQKVALSMLEAIGCRVTVVPNGLEAVSARQDLQYDVLFMDCMMPGMDGFEATEAIRAWEHGQKVPPLPIIALTANAMEGDRDRCLAAGMDSFVSKPVTRAALLRAMAAVVVR